MVECIGVLGFAGLLLLLWLMMVQLALTTDIYTST
jgi:hypothetical protein